MWDAGGLGRKMSPERKDRQRKQTCFQHTSDIRLVAIHGLYEYEEHTRRSKSTTGICLIMGMMAFEDQYTHRKS